MNFPVPFGAPSPPPWQNIGPGMPVFGMPPQRQPPPHQTPYIPPHMPAPNAQQFRPPPFPAGPMPLVMAAHPGDDVFLFHQEPVNMGGHGFAQMRAPMQPAAFPPPHHNQGVRFIPQHPPNMHSFPPQPLMQLSGSYPVQVQSCSLQQPALVTERAQLRRTKQDVVPTTAHMSQSSRHQPRTAQSIEVTRPKEKGDDESTTSSTAGAQAVTSTAGDTEPLEMPKTQLQEEKGAQDEVSEERSGNDSLDSEKTLVQSGFSSSHTSPSSSDSSPTLCSSPVSPPVSGDEGSSTDADEIPTKDQECGAIHKGKEGDNIAERDVGAGAKDELQRPATAVPKTETYHDSRHFCLPSGRFAQHVPSRLDRERNCCSTSCIEGKQSCPHRKPGQTNTTFMPQQPRRKIRSQIDRPVFQEKPSRVLTAQVPCSSAQRQDQCSENQEQCVRSYLTTHFRLLFEPIPQQPENSE